MSVKKIILIAVIILVAAVLITAGFFAWAVFKGSAKPGGGKILENPLKEIVAKNTVNGEVNSNAVIKQGVLEFNSDYVNYILIALGVGGLHKSLIGYGNPIVEFHLDNQVWSSELKDNSLFTGQGLNNDKDLIITMSKEEAVKAILSPDIKQFMKNSVINGNTKLEIISGNIELGSKGYLEMYNNLK